MILRAILVLSAAASLAAADQAPSLPDPLPLAASQEIAAPLAPGRVDALSNFYFDNLGLYVSTTGAEWALPLSAGLALKLRALVDWIGIYPPKDYAQEHADHLGGGHEGHEGHDPGGNPDAVPDGELDAVSGASARVGTTGESQETRAEFGTGLLSRGRLGGNPLALQAETRASYEPDYQSVSGLASGFLETHQGNTAWSGHVGFGLDRIDPPQANAVLGETWPALQLKVATGGAVNQTLTPRLSVGGGAAGSWLMGRLSSPYRRALVVTTLFPERLPSDRLRLTGFVQGAYYLGLGCALHSRQGFYVDSWDVKAWIPETALAKEFGSRFLVTLKHRYYFQRPAEFYKTSYAPGETLRTGDVRLGGLEEHTLGLEADWLLRRGAGTPGPLVLTAGYSYSYQEYWYIPGHTLASQAARLGASYDY